MMVYSTSYLIGCHKSAIRVAKENIKMLRKEERALKNEIDDYKAIIASASEGYDCRFERFNIARWNEMLDEKKAKIAQLKADIEKSKARLAELEIEEIIEEIIEECAITAEAQDAAIEGEIENAAVTESPAEGYHADFEQEVITMKKAKLEIKAKSGAAAVAMVKQATKATFQPRTPMGIVVGGNGRDSVDWYENAELDIAYCEVHENYEVKRVNVFSDGEFAVSIQIDASGAENLTDAQIAEMREALGLKVETASEIETPATEERTDIEITTEEESEMTTTNATVENQAASEIITTDAELTVKKAGATPKAEKVEVEYPMEAATEPEIVEVDGWKVKILNPAYFELIILGKTYKYKSVGEAICKALNTMAKQEGLVPFLLQSVEYKWYPNSKSPKRGKFPTVYVNAGVAIPEIADAVDKIADTWAENHYGAARMILQDKARQDRKLLWTLKRSRERNWAGGLTNSALAGLLIGNKMVNTYGEEVRLEIDDDELDSEYWVDDANPVTCEPVGKIDSGAVITALSNLLITALTALNTVTTAKVNALEIVTTSEDTEPENPTAESESSNLSAPTDNSPAAEELEVINPATFNSTPDDTLLKIRGCIFTHSQHTWEDFCDYLGKIAAVDSGADNIEVDDDETLIEEFADEYTPTEYAVCFEGRLLTSTLRLIKEKVKATEIIDEHHGFSPYFAALRYNAEPDDDFEGDETCELIAPIETATGEEINWAEIEQPAPIESVPTEINWAEIEQPAPIETAESKILRREIKLQRQALKIPTIKMAGIDAELAALDTSIEDYADFEEILWTAKEIDWKLKCKRDTQRWIDRINGEIAELEKLLATEMKTAA